MKFPYTLVKGPLAIEAHGYGGPGGLEVSAKLAAVPIQREEGITGTAIRSASVPRASHAGLNR